MCSVSRVCTRTRAPLASRVCMCMYDVSVCASVCTYTGVCLQGKRMSGSTGRA